MGDGKQCQIRLLAALLHRLAKSNTAGIVPACIGDRCAHWSEKGQACSFVVFADASVTANRQGQELLELQRTPQIRGR